MPQDWVIGDAWPRKSHDLCLKPEARDRVPCHNAWARSTFEQGALSLLPELHAQHPAVVLPGPKLFQANKVDTLFMRPAVFHCFGQNKSTAKTILQALALEGWETLPIVMLGVGNLRPLWQQSGWIPFAGVSWHGSMSTTTATQEIRFALFEQWHKHAPAASQAWLLQPPVYLTIMVPKRPSVLTSQSVEGSVPSPPIQTPSSAERAPLGTPHAQV